MASSVIYNKLKSKIEDTDNFINTMNDKITSGEYLEETVDDALQSYLYDWYSENSSEIYADDVIEIKATDDAYSTAILVENSDGTYTAYVNDDNKKITKYQGIENVKYDEEGNEFIMTASGEEIYNFRPPTASTLSASDVVGYIIGKDGRITYYMADGSCEISHEFEYNDGIIEYIECLICGDMALIQIRPITYTWHEEYELIYYDNYIETPDIIYGWDDTYTTMPELEPPFRIMWYTWKEDSDIIYFEVKIDDILIHYDWIEYERPELDHNSGLSYKLEKDYEHENRHLFFEFPVFWRRPEYCYLDDELTKETDEFKYGSCADCIINPFEGEGGGSWTGTGTITGTGAGESFDGGGSLDPMSHWVDIPKKLPKKKIPPEYEIPIIPPEPDPIIPVKRPIEKVLGCQRDDEGLTVTFGDRTWRIPYTYFNVYNKSCNTQDYDVYVDDDGYLILTMNHCEVIYNLGKATDYDGEDGDTTEDIYIDEYRIKQDIRKSDGSLYTHTVAGDLKFPHIKEALISDKQELLFRNDLGQYLISNAKYPNNNGNLGMFPYFTLEKDTANNLRYLVGNYYYPDTPYEDRKIKIPVGDPIEGNRSMELIGNEIRYHTYGTFTTYNVPDVDIYRGVTDVIINSDDSLSIVTDDGNTVSTSNTINYNIDSLGFTENKVVTTISDTYGITRIYEGSSNFSLDGKLDGDDGRYVTSTRDYEGWYQIWVGKETYSSEDMEMVITENPMIGGDPMKIDAKIPQSTTNLPAYDAPHIHMTKTFFNYDLSSEILMTQIKSPSTPTRLVNWVNTGYTSAFNGEDGRYFLTRSKTIESDGTLTVKLIDSRLNEVTLTDMAAESFVTGVEYRPTQKRIMINHTTDPKIVNTDIEGKDAVYVEEFITKDDYFFAKWNNSSLPQLLGEMKGFQGKEHNYPISANIDSYVLTFEMSSNDYVLDFADIRPDTRLIKDIYRVPNTNTVEVLLTNNDIIISKNIDDIDGIDGKLPSSLGVSEDRFLNIQVDGVQYETIHVWRADDAEVPDEVLLTNDRIEFTLNGNLIEKIDHGEKINANDGNLPVDMSYSNNLYDFTGSIDNFSVPMDVDAKDASILENIEYNAGKVNYTIGGIMDFIDIAPSDKPLDGEDALYIESVDTNSTYFNFNMSDGTIMYISDDINGEETNKSIVDVNFTDDRLSFVHKNTNVITYNDYLDTRHISTVKDGDSLTIDFSHYSFTTTDVDGTSFPDGKWITDVNTTQGEFKVNYNNSPEEVLGTIDTYDFNNIEIIPEGNLKITNPDGSSYTSIDSIVVPDATRILEYTSLVDFNLTLHFDTSEVWDIGYVRGDKSALDWNSSKVEEGLIKGVINNTTIFDTAEYDGNFGFENFISTKPYSKNDGVVHNGDVYILKDDIEYINEAPSKEKSTWSRVIMEGDVRSIVFPPSIISTIIDDEIILEAGALSTYYDNVDRLYRNFQVIPINGSWDSPIIDIDINKDVYKINENLPDNTYKWRCRDYVYNQDFPSIWSSEEIFEVVSENTYTPTLVIDTAYGLEPELTINNIIGDIASVDVLITSVNDQVSYNDNKNIFKLPFGVLMNDTQYSITVKITNIDNTQSKWSNAVSFNSGSNLDESLFSPVISISDINAYTPNITVLTDYPNYFSNLEELSTYGEWVILDTTTNETFEYMSLVDIENFHYQSDFINAGSSYEIKMRYLIDGVYSAWSNSVTYNPSSISNKPTISITKDSKPLVYNIELNYTGEDFNHFSTTWEFEDNTTGTLLKTYTQSRNFRILLNEQLPVDWINKNIRVRAKMGDNKSVYCPWSDWNIFTVDSFNNIIAEPKIVDYFVHDFGVTIVNGTITEPEQLQYEVTDMDGNIYKQYDVLYNDTLGRLERNIKVPHTEFSKSTLYKMKARQYHSSLGWSEWSNEEIFGYDYKDVAGDYILNLPVDLPYMSIVAVGAGGGGCKYVTTNHTGGGGSLNFITNVPIKDDFLKITVGEGGISHTDGTDTIISSYIKAGAGTWSTTGGDSGDAEQLLKGACDIVVGLYSGGKGGVYGGGGAAGYASNGAEGGIISSSGESGSGGGGTSNDTSDIGGGISLLGSSPRVMNVGDDGGVFYTGTPVAGGGGKLHATDHKGMDGGVGILYGILKYPLGFTAPWNEDNQ